MKIEVPALNTERLILRAFEPGDALTLFRILQQKDILRFFPTTEPPAMDRVEKLIEKQIAHWQEYQCGWWAVIHQQEGSLLGWNGLQYLPETDEIEVGYLLSKPYWGQGLATEGAEASLQYGFDVLDLDFIVGLVHPDNIASQRVLEKIGLTFSRIAPYFGMDLMRYEISSPARGERYG